MTQIESRMKPMCHIGRQSMPKRQAVALRQVKNAKRCLAATKAIYNGKRPENTSGRKIHNEMEIHAKEPEKSHQKHTLAPLRLRRPSASRRHLSSRRWTCASRCAAGEASSWRAWRLALSGTHAREPIWNRHTFRTYSNMILYFTT